MPDDIKTYEERHVQGPLYAALVFALMVFYAIVAVGAVRKHYVAIAAFTGIVFIALLAVLVNFWRLTFEVSSTQITFGFGLIRKRFPRGSVMSCEPFELTLRNYPGFGVRLGRDGTVAWSTRNGPGVKLTFEGAKRPYVVSVDEPAYICKILGQDIGG